MLLLFQGWKRELSQHTTKRAGLGPHGCVRHIDFFDSSWCYKKSYGQRESPRKSQECAAPKASLRGKEKGFQGAQPISQLHRGSFCIWWEISATLRTASLCLAKSNFLSILWPTTIIWRAANWWAGQSAPSAFYRTCCSADTPLQTGRRVLAGDPSSTTGDSKSLLDLCYLRPCPLPHPPTLFVGFAKISHNSFAHAPALHKIATVAHNSPTSCASLGFFSFHSC